MNVMEEVCFCADENFRYLFAVVKIFLHCLVSDMGLPL